MDDVKLCRVKRHIEYLIRRYLHEVRSLKELNWRNKIKAINTYSLQVIRHPAVTVRWPREDRKLYTKTTELIILREKKRQNQHPETVLKPIEKNGGRKVQSHPN